MNTSGTAYCWGYNGYGQLGNGTEINNGIPFPVTGAPSQTYGSVSAGGLHSCAVNTTGTAYCWGANGYGQLGNGSTNAGNNIPFPVGPP